jgi:NAD(P)H-hydrate repair Nnr-like enzyme with NAD(P)H-hydrate dehydratase domain
MRTAMTSLADHHAPERDAAHHRTVSAPRWSQRRPAEWIGAQTVSANSEAASTARAVKVISMPPIPSLNRQDRPRHCTSGCINDDTGRGVRTLVFAVVDRVVIGVAFGRETRFDVSVKRVASLQRASALVCFDDLGCLNRPRCRGDMPGQNG